MHSSKKQKSHADKQKKKSIKETCREGRTTSLATLSSSKSNGITERIDKRRAAIKQDKVALTKVASLLESKLTRIEEDHKETLLQIEEQKKRDMAKIHRECMVEQKRVLRRQREDEESSSHDVEVVRETIHTLRDTNKIIRRQNQDLMEEIDEIKAENRRLFEATGNLYRAIKKVQEEIKLQEERHAHLKQAEQFLKSRKREYENARFEADQDIDMEKEKQQELRRKLVNVVAAIDQRCPERGLANAIYNAVKKDFAEIDATTMVTL